jgi:hypothetical protein
MLTDELYSKLEDGIFADPDKAKVEILLDAINDWPDAVTSVTDFIKLLQIDLNSVDITHQLIHKKQSKLDVAVDAWKMEAYASILKLIRLCDGKSLNDIVSDFEKLR